MSENENADRCDRAPPGWACSRHKGHDGPCAALELEPTPDVTALAETLRELREIDRGTLEQVATELTMAAALHSGRAKANATALLLLGRVAYLSAHEGRRE
jgi:hypothetical protein